MSFATFQRGIARLSKKFQGEVEVRKCFHDEDKDMHVAILSNGYTITGRDGSNKVCYRNKFHTYFGEVC